LAFYYAEKNMKNTSANGIKENGKIVKCPECGSTDVRKVLPFDYVKMCMNDGCAYYLLKTKKRYRYQFSTGVHN